MAENSDVNIKFGADINDLKDKLGQIPNLFNAITEHFAAMIAIVAGGAAFKSFIDETNNLNSEAMKLSKTLGITGEDAGTLNTALGDIGSDADTYTGAFLKFNRALRTNSDEMKAMGVDIDGFKSGQKSSNEVFAEAIKLVGQYAPGIDQTQAAMKLFGRSVSDVQTLLRLNNDILEEAKKKNQELNLVITEEGVAASRKYKIAMNDVQDVLHGLEKTVGEAVIPHFTEMAQKLASIGPVLVEGMQYLAQVMVNVWDRIGESIGKAWDIISDYIGKIAVAFGGESLSGMELFKNGLQGLQDALYDLLNGVDAVVSGIGEMLLVVAQVNSLFASFSEQTDRATDQVGIFTEIGRALGDVFRVIAMVAANVIYVLQAMGREIAAIAAQIVALAHLDINGFRAISDAVKEDGVRARAEIDALTLRILGIRDAGAGRGLVNPSTGGGSPTLEIHHGTPKGAPPGGTRHMDIGKAGKDDATLAAQLAQQKAEQEAELALAREYLKEEESINDEAYKNNLISLEQFYDAKLAIELEGINTTLEVKRKELADAAKAEADAQRSSASAIKPEERNKFDAQAIKFKTEQIKLQGDINVLEAQSNDALRKNADERKAAGQKLNDELAVIRATSVKAGVDAELALEKGSIDQAKAMRQIDADQAFAAQKALEDRSYAATQDFLAAKRALIHGEDLKAIAQQAADEEAAERAHQQKITEIDRAAQLERAKYSIQAQQSVQSSFATMLNDLMSGQKKLGDVLRSFAQSIVNTFQNIIAQRFAEKLFGEGTAGGKLIDSIVTPITNAINTITQKWLVGVATQTAADRAASVARQTFRASELASETATATAKTGVAVAAETAKTGATVAGATTRTAVETTAAATSQSLTIGEAISSIGAKAWQAAASVYASIAEIPVIGPFLAPAMAVAAGAMVMGFVGRIASAEGGWDEVPQDQVAAIHKKEMILPAALAEGMRNIAAPGRLSDAIEQPVNAAVDAVADRFRPDAQQHADVRAMTARWSVPASSFARVGSMAQAPARAAEAAAMESSSAKGAGKAPVREGDVHLHLAAYDSKDAKRFLLDNAHHVASAVRRHGRDLGAPDV
jgi:hypothetical protein